VCGGLLSSCILFFLYIFNGTYRHDTASSKKNGCGVQKNNLKQKTYYFFSSKTKPELAPELDPDLHTTLPNLYSSSRLAARPFQIQMESSDAYDTASSPSPDLPTPRERISSLDGLNIQSVTIPNYQTQHGRNNENFTTYSLYIITNDGDEWSVYRRYSQFLKLHMSLPESLRNEIPMPPKKYQGNLSDTFVTKRQKELEKYIQSLLALPKENLSSTDVGSFLGCDLHSRPQTKGSGSKPSALKNKNMTEFNWVHRTGGMNKPSPNTGKDFGTRGGDQTSSKRSMTSSGGGGGDGGGCVLL